MGGPRNDRINFELAVLNGQIQICFNYLKKKKKKKKGKLLTSPSCLHYVTLLLTFGERNILSVFGHDYDWSSCIFSTQGRNGKYNSFLYLVIVFLLKNIYAKYITTL